MLSRVVASAIILFSATAAHAGDPEAGVRLYARHCAACHMLAAPDGTTVMRGGASGPNLFGIVGQPAGTVAGFTRYGADLAAAGEAGLVWDAETLDAYLADPRALLRAVLDNPRAGSRMVFRLRAGSDRRDIIAYLEALSAD